MVAPPFSLHCVASRLPSCLATRLRNYRTIRLHRCQMITFEEIPSYQMTAFLILLILFLIHLDNRLAISSMRLYIYVPTELPSYITTRLLNCALTRRPLARKERPERRSLNSA